MSAVFGRVGKRQTFFNVDVDVLYYIFYFCSNRNAGMGKVVPSTSVEACSIIFFNN